MTDKRFKEIYDRNKGNNMQLCFEYFSEFHNVPFHIFNQHFPVWITNFKIDELMFTGNIRGITEQGLVQIIEYLKNKHNYVV